MEIKKKTLLSLTTDYNLHALGAPPDIHIKIGSND